MGPLVFEGVPSDVYRGWRLGRLENRKCQAQGLGLCILNSGEALKV